MSATYTIHYACDRCGKQADVHTETLYGGKDTGPSLPEGWGQDWTAGVFCSEFCLDATLVEQAHKNAAASFAPKVPA